MSRFEGLSVPGPTVTKTSEPFWAAVNDGILRLQRCASCHRWIFYPRETCPYCWGSDLPWEDASGRGRIKTFSDVVRPGNSGWAPASPYTVVLIELVEGPTMLSLLLVEGEAEAWIGAEVLFSPVEIGGRILPTFSLDPDQVKESQDD